MPKSHFIPQSLDPSVLLRDIAAQYGVSMSTASRWRRTVLAGEVKKVQRSFFITSRILGILWAIGGDNGECFYLRCRHREFIEEVRNFFKVDAQIISGKSRTGEQYKLKITGDVRQAILAELSSRGWSSRMADVREYPSGDIDHKEFIRAWVQLHSYYYARKNHLRIYGNHHLMIVMNDIISRLTGVGVKTPQKLHNEKTYGLCYQNPREVNMLLQYFNIMSEI